MTTEADQALVIADLTNQNTALQAAVTAAVAERNAIRAKYDLAKAQLQQVLDAYTAQSEQNLHVLAAAVQSLSG